MNSHIKDPNTLLKILVKMKEEHVIDNYCINVRNATTDILNILPFFVASKLGYKGYVNPDFYVYDNHSFSLNKSPHYSFVTKRIFFPEKGNYGYSDMDLSSEMFIHGHETCHYIQDVFHKIGDRDLNQIESKILMESQADYFAGWFISYCVSRQLLSANDIPNIEKFVQSLGVTVPDFIVDNTIKHDEDAGFRLINDNYHGTQGHRLNMFRLGLHEGDKNYFSNIENFIPSNIRVTKFSIAGDETNAEDMLKEFQRMANSK